MENEKEKKEEATDKPATQAQIQLIETLYEEIDYKRRYSDTDLMKLSRNQASQHIAYLKEAKVRDQALRAANKHSKSFDKIGFCMVYKLLWNACLKMPRAQKPTRQEFSNTLNEEYALFKYCLDECKEFVEDGGLE